MVSHAEAKTLYHCAVGANQRQLQKRLDYTLLTVLAPHADVGDQLPQASHDIASNKQTNKNARDEIHDSWLE